MIENISILRWVWASSVLIVLLLAFALFTWRIKHGNFAQPNQKKRLKIIEIQHISPRHKLVLIRIDETEQALIIGPEGVTLLGIHGAQKGAISAQLDAKPAQKSAILAQKSAKEVKKRANRKKR